MTDPLAVPSSKEVLDMLERRNIKSAVVAFSGGNDEGDVEDIILTSNDNQQAKLPRHWPITVRPFHRKTYEVSEGIEDGDRALLVAQSDAAGTPLGYKIEPLTSDAISDTMLWRGLAAPVYDRYGSFAGDFSVSGTVVWDVAGRYYEQASHTSTFSEDYEVESTECDDG